MVGITQSAQTGPDRSIVAFLILLTVIRLVFAASIDFIEDEAYYRLWGLYPAFAYFDHAPMVGWMIAVGQTLCGDTVLGVRLFSPLSAFVGSVVIWRIASVSFDRKTADHAVILFNAMLLIGVGSVLMTPDVPSLLFWGLALWTLVEWQHSRRNAWWIAFGVAAGLGLLSKYTNAFFGLGVLLWLLLSGQWRAAFRAPQFWLAGVIAGFAFAPVIIWNAAHEWISFTRQFERLQPHAFTLRFFAEWIGGQIGLISPLIALFVALSLGRSRGIFKDLAAPRAAIAITMLPLLFYFLMHVFTSPINANWAAPAYVNFALLAAPVVAAWRGEGSALKRRLAIIASPLGYGLALAVFIAALFPVLPADWRTPLDQIRGYPALADTIGREAERLGTSTIATSRYQLTALIDYQMRGEARVVQLTERLRYLNEPPARADLGRGPVLYVARSGDAQKFITSYRACFASAEFIRSVTRDDRGITLNTYDLWRLNGVNPRLVFRGDAADCS